jgi:hypothetical protein
LALGAGSAAAADLGGNCCADLEERVAELEATTARKGNRKMSLTITGQVNRGVLWWDDGGRSDVYYGLDNTNSSSRFSFLGSAKITSAVSAGFEIMVEIEAGGTSSKVNQFDEDGKVGTQIAGNPATDTVSFNAANADAYGGDWRRALWWLEHKDLGRLTVGRSESAGVVTTVDLGGISVVASGSVVLLNGGFLVRSSAVGGYGAINWGSLGDPASNQGRTELIRYDSPSLRGFIASASVAEAGDYWGAMLRYAGEFSGFRIAGGIGYERATDRASGAPTGPDDLSPAVTGATPEVDAWGVGLSVLHVPSGLFAQGHYMAAEFSCDAVGATNAGGYWGWRNCKADADQWMIQAGITKNWTGLGNTAIYGEYSQSNDWGADKGLGRDYTGAVGSVSIFDVTATELTVWGLGIVQNVDAAATELYLGWRHFSADVTGATVNGGAQVALPIEDADFVFGGARVKF